MVSAVFVVFKMEEIFDALKSYVVALISVVYVDSVMKPTFAASKVCATAEAFVRFALRVLAPISVDSVVSAPSKTSVVSVVLEVSLTSVVSLRLDLQETFVASVASAMRLSSETSASFVKAVALETSDLLEVSPAFAVNMNSDQAETSVRCATAETSEAFAVRNLLEMAQVSVVSVKSDLRLSFVANVDF